MSHRKWKLRVRHILDAIRRITEYTDEMEFADFSADNRTIDAVVRNMQVIGEAARLIPQNIQDLHPEVPWRMMRSMRNVLVHDYDRINPMILWETIRHDLPPLPPLFKRILSEEPGE